MVDIITLPFDGPFNHAVQVSIMILAGATIAAVLIFAVFWLKGKVSHRKGGSGNTLQQPIAQRNNVFASVVSVILQHDPSYLNDYHDIVTLACLCPTLYTVVIAGTRRVTFSQTLPAYAKTLVQNHGTRSFLQRLLALMMVRWRLLREPARSFTFLRRLSALIAFDVNIINAFSNIVFNSGDLPKSLTSLKVRGRFNLTTSLAEAFPQLNRLNLWWSPNTPKLIQRLPNTLTSLEITDRVTSFAGLHDALVNSGITDMKYLSFTQNRDITISRLVPNAPRAIIRVETLHAIGDCTFEGFHPTKLLRASPKHMTTFVGVERVEIIEFQCSVAQGMDVFGECLSLLKCNQHWAAHTVRFIDRRCDYETRKRRLVVGPNVTHIECNGELGYSIEPHEFGAFGIYCKLDEIVAPSAQVLDLNWFKLQSLADVPNSCRILHACIDRCTTGIDMLPSSIQELGLYSCDVDPSADRIVDLNRLTALTSLSCIGPVAPRWESLPSTVTRLGCRTLPNFHIEFIELASALKSTSLPLLRGLEFFSVGENFFLPDVCLPNWVEEVRVTLHPRLEMSTALHDDAIMRMLVKHNCVSQLKFPHEENVTLVEYDLALLSVKKNDYYINFPWGKTQSPWDGNFNRAILDLKKIATL